MRAGISSELALVECVWTHIRTFDLNHRNKEAKENRNIIQDLRCMNVSIRGSVQCGFSKSTLRTIRNELLYNEINACYKGDNLSMRDREMAGRGGMGEESRTNV